MNAKRGRKAIKPSIKRLIFEKAVKGKGMPRLALAVELKNLIEEMGEIPPSEETMMRLISQARNHPASPLDEPWNTASLAKYPIPPEALPSVLQVWVHVQEKQNDPFTVRMALWASRLYATIKDTELLAFFSQGHSDMEIFSEMAGMPFLDTGNVDLRIFSLMTNQNISSERQKKILRLSDEQSLALQKLESRHILNLVYIFDTQWFYKQEEAQNERPHNKEG